MKTAVVILNWNGRDYLQKFLPALVEHTTLPDVQLIVADNASTDTSIPFLQEHYPQIHTITLERNYGFAEGYNRALAQVDAEYYILLNSDVEVTAGWIEPLIAQLDTHPTSAACQPKIHAYHKPTHFEHAGACGGFLDALGYPYCRGRIMHHTAQDNGQYDTADPSIFWATGACLAIRSSIYHQLGGLDAQFFAHMEEIDLCWRIKSRGHDIHCVTTSIVRHVGGGTLSAQNPRKTHLNFRNNLLMLYKNMPTSQLWWVMPLRLLLDYLAALQMLVSGKYLDAQAVVRARRDFWRMRPNYRTVRKENLRLTTTPRPQGWTHRSILWDFYLRGKRQ